jgi:hypothetical protein
VPQPTQILLDFIKRYGPPAGAMGPVNLVKEVFKATPDGWQGDVLQDFGRGERRIAIRSAHGPGKTCVVAWMVWAMLLTRFPQKTVATAPTKGQLFDGLFVEILSWGNRLPPVLKALYNFKSDRIELIAAPSESFFTARSARPEMPEALQGIHSEHVLIVADEASGIPEPIFEAGSGSMSGDNAITMLLGNPVRTSGLFFDVFNKMSDMWKTYHIRAASVDWPTGIPSERVIPDFVEDIARRYGEESNAYRIRVLGEFPKGDENTVVPFELVESSRMRDIVTVPGSPCVWGVDVARFGSARNALAVRTKRELISIEVWEGVDLMQTSGRIKAKWDATMISERPQTILIDVNGLGGGVVDRLNELGLPVRGINVAESANIDDRFHRLRDELWWRVREWFEGRDVKLPPPTNKEHDPVEITVSELVKPTYKFQSSGKIKVESKDEMRKRGVPSPDLADAFMLTFAEDVSILMGGRYGGAAWNEELPDRSVGVP